MLLLLTRACFLFACGSRIWDEAKNINVSNSYLCFYEAVIALACYITANW